MAFTLKAGETISIPEDLHVAGVKQNQSGWLDGFRIAAPRKDGSGEYRFYGDITPVGIGRVGKALSAGTAVGKIAASGITVFEGSDYNLLIIFPTDDELEKTFPDQTKNPPRTLSNTPVKKTPGGEVPIFFDVKPPKSAYTPQNAPPTSTPASPTISANVPVEACQQADPTETPTRHFQVLAKTGQLPPIRVSPDEDAQQIGTWSLNTELEFECARVVRMRSGGRSAPWYRMSSEDGYHGWLSPVFDNLRPLDFTPTAAR